MFFVRTDYSDDKKWNNIKSIINEQSKSYPDYLVDFLDNIKYASDIPICSTDRYYWIIDSKTMKDNEILLVAIKEQWSVRVVIKEVMWITFGLYDDKLDFDSIYDNATNGVFSLLMLPLFGTEVSNEEKQELSIKIIEEGFQGIVNRVYDDKDYEFFINNFAVIEEPYIYTLGTSPTIH